MIVSGFLEVVSVILHVKMFGVVRYFVNLKMYGYTFIFFRHVFKERQFS